MRISALDIVGFRGFATRQIIDLDADTVIVVGANGKGKTSLFDAVLWALVGQVPRLRDGSVVSLFASGARVELGLRDDDRGSIRVIRSSVSHPSEGEGSRLYLEIGKEHYEGADADGRLWHLLWPEALAAAEPNVALASALERGVYLQQDRVRDFVEARSDQDRFAVVSELIGAGRISDLQIALEKERKAWSQVTNERSHEVDALRERIARLQDELTRWEADDEATLDVSWWQQWWSRNRDLRLLTGSLPSADAADAPSRIDAEMRALGVLRDSELRRRQEAILLADAIHSVPVAQEDLIQLRTEAESAEIAMDHAQRELANREMLAAEVRKAQTQLAESREQLRALAQLALLNLGDHCPVCQQTYDRIATKARLEGVLAGTHPDDDSLNLPDVASAALELQERQNAALVSRHKVEAAEARARELAAQMAALQKRVANFGLPGDRPETWTELLAEVVSEIDQRIAAITALRNEGEQLALILARTGQHARVNEVKTGLQTLQRQLSSLEADVAVREDTTAKATTIINALRTASSEVVGTEVGRLEPLMQRIYSTADPHPAFRVARLISRMQRGHGQLVSSLTDPMRNVTGERPEAVLSSSQMNVLAVSIFLAFNLGMASLPLQTAILDDPLQSLDDINLLGLIDLLRRIQVQRQLLISTHDRRFASLLERKLRPISSAQRTRVISFESWSPEGVDLVSYDVEPDTAGIRIVS